MESFGSIDMRNCPRMENKITYPPIFTIRVKLSKMIASIFSDIVDGFEVVFGEEEESRDINFVFLLRFNKKKIPLPKKDVRSKKRNKKVASVFEMASTVCPQNTRTNMGLGLLTEPRKKYA